MKCLRRSIQITTAWHPSDDRKSAPRGFTLVELLVVIAIIGVLVATVSDSVDARWSDPAAPPIAVGAHLAVGKGVLSTGVIQITFDSEANIVLEAPAGIDLISDSEARLRKGPVIVASSAVNSVPWAPEANKRSVFLLIHSRFC